MAFLPRRVKDIPPLEPDSEDDRTPQKGKNVNKNINELHSGESFKQRNIPKRVSELPPLEPDSDEDECKNDRFNCAILNDSIMSPAISDNDDNSPKKSQNPTDVVSNQQPADDSFLSMFDKMKLNVDTLPSKKTEDVVLPAAQIHPQSHQKLPLKPIQEHQIPTKVSGLSIIISQPPTQPPTAAAKEVGVGVEIETPLKQPDNQFATPQIRSWSVARRPKDLCSTSRKERTAIANEFRSQKVLFQTPMAVARAPHLANNSITLSLCDTMNESGTPGTAENQSKSKSPQVRSEAEIKSKKSLAFSEQEAELKNTEAVKSKENIIMINGSEYEIRKKLGCGGSSSVYLAQRKDSGKDCALKIVDLRGDAAVVEGYLNETKLLAKLQGNICVVSLYEYELLAKESKLYMVMEKGDSDLHKILSSYKTNLPLYVLMNFWYQMLQSVSYIHQNGVIHSDLKPANFLMVHGRLKLIDFGIASNIAIDSTSIIKFSQAGTFNYISPEALIDTSTGNSPMGKNQPKIKISTKSDVWSLGCILYLLMYQKTPFGHIKNIYAKVNAITSPSTEIQYPALPSYYPVMLVQMAKKCLQHNPKQRPSCIELLQYPFNMIIPIQNLSVT
ncbi:probable serine/threonine-protein kinase mps1 [Eupeodes corollae]|uniref:probable serine/threonine-protein kinase mps1 n=1 Tax=Eupeodes corollae TaxID=290404 RepID=UPI002491CB30|nr:probable serine/threonine-protein kinase mps1 [Eupeodes corollae]